MIVIGGWGYSNQKPIMIMERANGGGVLPWIPDIEIWAKNIAGSLRAAGTFVLCEKHPLTSCLEGTDSGITVASDYFGRGDRPETDTGWRHFPGGEDATSTKVQFVWPLGDVITALIAAGLIINNSAR